MAINVEVIKGERENNLGIIRKFTKKVQGSGVLPHLRNKRYSSRKLSEYVKKKKALKKIESKAKTQEMIKMGKISKSR